MKRFHNPDGRCDRKKYRKPSVIRIPDQVMNPKLTAIERKMAKEGDFENLVYTVARRLKQDRIGWVKAALIDHRPVRLSQLPLPISGVEIINDGDDLVVSVNVQGRRFEVIRHYIGKTNFPGVISHYTSAGGMRDAIHRQADGCDERFVKRGKKIKLVRCTKNNHP